MGVSRRMFIRSAAVSTGTALLPPGRLSLVPEESRASVDYHDWDAVRNLFALEPGLVNAALFYLASNPRPIREAIERHRERLNANPLETVEAGAFGEGGENLCEAAVAAVARYIGADAGDIALTNSTTHGLAVAYQGLKLGPEDEILNTEHDHYVQLETVRLVSERTGAKRRKVRLFPGHDAGGATAADIIRRLRDAISPATRVLGVTWVSSANGLKMPLKPLADAVREINAKREPARRVKLLVDGVHGLGAAEQGVVATGVDIFVSGLHKWMLGPRGTGIVWARPEIWEQMSPVVVSFNSVELYNAWRESKPVPRPFHARYFGLGGFQAYEHIWAVPSAVRMHEAIGPKRVQERILALNGRLREALSRMPHVSLRTPLDPALTAGITTFEVEGQSPEESVHKLRQHGIVASTSPYTPTYVRLLFGLANSEADIDKSIAAVKALV